MPRVARVQSYGCGGETRAQAGSKWNPTALDKSRGVGAESVELAARSSSPVRPPFWGTSQISFAVEGKRCYNGTRFSSTSTREKERSDGPVSC